MSASAASSRRGSRRNTASAPTSQSGQTSPRGTSPAGAQQISGVMERLKLTGKSRQLHPRSSPGTAGKALTVTTNHFKINSSDAPEKIFKWNVDIKKANIPNARIEPVGRVNRRVLEILLQHQTFQSPVYTDYEKTLISFYPLTPSPTSPTTYNVDYYEPEEPGPRAAPNKLIYTVIVTAATEPLLTQPLKDLMNNPGPALPRADEYEAAMNIMLLRFAGQHRDLTTVARGTKVFSLLNDSTRHELGKGLWMLRGYIRRIRVLQGGFFLCLNTTAGVVWEESWADLVIAKWRPPHPPKSDEDYMAQLDQSVQRVKVQGMFGDPHRVKSIVGVFHHQGKYQSASEATFHCDRHPTTNAPMNRAVSVKDYFKMAYPNLNIRDPKIVLKVGSSDRWILWPAAACKILPGQPYKKALPFSEQSQQMIRFACRDPKGNINFIQDEGLRMLGVRRANPQARAGRVTASPLQVWMEMETAPARRLQPPSIKFLNNSMSAVDAAKGQWNLRDRQFSKAGEIKPYTVLVFREQNERQISNLAQFASMLGSESAKYLNLPTSQTKPKQLTPHDFVYPLRNQVAWLKERFQECLGEGIKYCFIVSSSSKWYGDIKSVADKLGMQTSITLRKRDGTVKSSMGEIANLMLKFNWKLGGVNWSLNMSEFKILGGKTTMFVGIDVVHAPPGAMKGAPSVAAVVASTGPNPGQFPGVIELQHHEDPTKKAIEMIPKLNTMFASRLELWAKLNHGDLPQLLFIYRDGVSDSQLEHVLNIEVPLIEEACKAVYGKFGKQLPQMYVQSTQKRHIVRFYAPPNDRSGAFDQRGNPLPGLVVDKKVVSPKFDDWYSVSHKCLQGTSRPAHNFRILDQIGGTLDDLQALTNALAYVFGRSVTSISIPTPARLADRLCERAKYRLHSVYFPTEPGLLYQRGDRSNFQGQSDIHSDIVDTMYYI